MALAQDAGQASEIAQAQFYAGMCEVYASKVGQGISHLSAALSMARTLGDHHLAGLALMYLGGAALAQGDLVGAESSFAESLASFEQAVDGRFAGNLHVNLGWFVGRRGDIIGAIRHVRIGLEAGARFEERRLLSAAIQVALSLSAAAQRESDLTRRARLLGAVDGISQATGQTLMQRVLAADLDALRAAIGGDEDAELETQIQEEYQRGRSMRFAVATEEARAFLRDLTTAHKGKALTSPAERARGAAHGSWAAEASLTARQQDVLRLVAQGLSNKDIAQRLYLSANTVTYHLRSIFNKLDAATRAQAVAVAARQGML
jgi:DNA-binding NarL/FixJ family response regulator